MGLLGFLGGNSGGGTPKYAKKALQGMWEKTEQVANRPFEPYTGQLTAGLSPTQQLGIQGVVNAVNSNVGGSAVNSAIDLAKQAGAYRPLTVTPGTMASSMMTPAAMQPVADVTAASIDPAVLDRVRAGTFLGGDVTAYLSPYIAQVIGTTTADLNRQREVQRQTDNARAVSAQAFGGSRQAVVDAETNATFNNTLANTVANLYSQGYGQAAELMMRDYDRALQADTANQGANQYAVGQNAGFLQQAALANQSNRYNQALADAQFRQQAAQYNQAALQDTARINLEAAMQAQQLNQAAGLSAANLGLNASSNLGQLGKTQQDMALAGSGALLQAGTLEQATEQARLEAAYNQYLRQFNYPVEMLGVLQDGARVMTGASARPQMGLLDVQKKWLENDALAIQNLKSFMPMSRGGEGLGRLGGG